MVASMSMQKQEFYVQGVEHRWSYGGASVINLSTTEAFLLLAENYRKGLSLEAVGITGTKTTDRKSVV